jgi:outer membrane receptor protein involved in Fe transport
MMPESAQPFKFLFLSVMLWVLLPCLAFTQTHFLSGSVRDGSTNELLPFATIYIQDVASGTSTDANGTYKLALKSGSYTLQISLIGYRTEIRHIEMADKDLTLHLKLLSTDILLQEVTVYSSQAEKAPQTEVSSLSLQSQRIIETTNVIPDVFRSIQTLPGITSDNEMSAKFNVRGGTSDENLVLVNGAQVYEPFHVKEAPNASIGIFNADLIQKVTLVTGGFSAKYGDRMSSVMDISYREGNREQLRGAATLSLTDLNGFLEGPLTPNGSFIFGARKSYLEYAMSLLQVDQSVHPSFYDVQGVLTYSLSKSDKLQFEFIHAGDSFMVDPSTDVSGPYNYNAYYNGSVAGFREASSYFEDQHAHYISNLFDLQSTSFLSTSALLKNEISYYEQIEEEYGYNTSNYSKDIHSTQTYFYRSLQEYLYTNSLDIRTIEAKSSVELQLTPFYELNLGVSYQTILYNQRLVDRRTLDEQSNMTQFPDTTSTHRVDSAVDAANESLEARSYKVAFYTENVMQLSDKFILNIGGRIDYFDVNKDLNVSPRFNAAYHIFDQTTIRAAWGLFYQSPIYRQLAYSFASDTNTKAQEATHYLIGVEHVIPFDPSLSRSLTIKLESYFKRYDNLISSTRTSSGRISYSRQNDATGSARGVDLYLALSLKNFYSWLSYGLLDAREDLRNDAMGEYPRFTDQRHTVSFVGDWTLGSRWSANLRVQYGSGYAYTPSVLQYNSQKRQWEWVPGETNSATLPPYRRVDIRLSKEFQIADLSASAFLDVSNILNYSNVQSYRYRFDKNGNPYVQEITLWPILPTLGLTVKF